VMRGCCTGSSSKAAVAVAPCSALVTPENTYCSEQDHPVSCDAGCKVCLQLTQAKPSVFDRVDFAVCGVTPGSTTLACHSPPCAHLFTRILDICVAYHRSSHRIQPWLP
jgi:hypothetical protein